MKRRNFIKGCICCAAIPFLTSCGYKITEKNPQKYLSEREKDENPEFPWIGHIEIHITEHCNLNCKYCSHFSTIAEEYYYSVEQFENDIKRIADLTKKHVENLEILGGEPLLHPQINELLSIARKYLPYTNIELLTNGLLLNTIPDSFWETIKTNYINLVPSLYPVKINWESILNKAEKFGLKITTDDQQDTLNLENIPKYTVKAFYKVHVDPDGNQNPLKPCQFKNACVQLFDGKLYPCFVTSNIRHFNKKFDKDIPVEDSDYIDIYQAESVEEINKFLENQNVKFCSYCAGTAYPGEDWKAVPEHTIDEWLYNKKQFEGDFEGLFDN